MKKFSITTIMVGILFSQPTNAIFGTKLNLKQGKYKETKKILILK